MRLFYPVRQDRPNSWWSLECFCPNDFDIAVLFSAAQEISWWHRHFWEFLTLIFFHFHCNLFSWPKLSLFSLLPLGQRVLDRLCAIIDDELQSIGAQKVHLSLIGPKELWGRTDRWNLMGSEMIRLRDRTDAELCLQVDKLFSDRLYWNGNNIITVMNE